MPSPLSHREVHRPGPLLAFLAEAFGCSGRAAKRWLDARRVLVNGRRVWMARHPLQPGDRVEMHDAPAPGREAPLPVLYEDPDVLVVDKPAGLLSNGSRSVESRLRTLRGEPALTAAHRLDRDTTGCLLFARSDAAREALINAFRAGRVEKDYEALVAGRADRLPREILRPIEGRSARTRVRVLRAGHRASRLRLRIDTGRTHQIRRHLVDEGCPVLGDRAYGTARSLPPDLRAVPRPMLHALRLAFPHPVTGVRVEAEAPLPADFRDWLARLGLDRPGAKTAGSPTRPAASRAPRKEPGKRRPARRARGGDVPPSDRRP